MNTIKEVPGLSVKHSVLELRTGKGCMHLWLFAYDEDDHPIETDNGLSFQSMIVKPAKYQRAFDLLQLWSKVKGGK